MTDYIEQIQTTANLSGGTTLKSLIAMASIAKWRRGLARRDQIPPPDPYFIWLLLAGRGSGKTRSGAEEIFAGAVAEPGQRIAVIGPTSGDVRKTCFEGESGLLSVIPNDLIKQYNRSAGGELWLHDPHDKGPGSYLIGYSAEEPERLRGPQHHRAWCDELAAWRYLEETWDMMMFGLRLGRDPNVIITTTPKPLRLLKELLKTDGLAWSKASMFDNAENLPPRLLEKLKKKYEGTRLGRQELYAEILDDNPFAMWQIESIDSARCDKMPKLSKIVVGVDPPASANENSDECGIVAVGKDFQPRGHEHVYVLGDRSVQGQSPEGWASEAVRLYHDLSADYIVAEVNNGGDMVASVINNVDPSVPVVKVHATRGKVVRAEPVSMLYEQGRAHHVGRFGVLEDQMCDFSSDFDKKKKGYSPDRVDALVWAVHKLTVEKRKGRAGTI